MPLTSSQNLLPQDGEAYYYGKVFTSTKAGELFRLLMERTAWSHDEIRMFGKTTQTSRKIAWYGDKEFEYSYSGSTRKAELWFPELSNLRRQIEVLTGNKFNSCLLNLYHDGSEAMGWHSDNEPELGEFPVIASLSLGEERKFLFKHRASGEKISLILEEGSLLLMQGRTQEFWLHSLPKSKKVTTPRINLTFREIKRVKK